MDQMDGLDASDRRLVEALREGIAHGQYEVGMQNENSDEVEESQDSSSLESSVATPAATPDAPGEVDFMAALNAFRVAKKGGDPEAIAAAERHLQEVTRAELAATEGCASDGASHGEQGAPGAYGPLGMAGMPGMPGMDGAGFGGSCAFGGHV